MYPDDYFFAESHEWIKIEGNTGTVGVTDFAQKQLGDVVYIELPETGAVFGFHQSFGVVESVKAVSDIYSPIAGEVIEVNSGLNDSPELLNEDPHGNGWIMRIKVKDKEELQKLMSISEYEKFLESQED
ncbi:MAG: glycine cleavage system protein GcvH [Candidatus Aminicenantes bacterium]|nr:glycine cleavage system protein GcvH [Candidatus Aminicenantes bacterium]